MINLQLYILNDTGQSYDEVELYDNETVNYTQSLQDVRDIAKIFTDFTRTFNVPASKTNNKIFKHFHNYFIQGFDPKKRHKAKIYLNYKLYKEGYIKLEGATTKDNKPFTYKLTFFGNGLILKDVLREAKLSSLIYLKSLDFDYTSDNVISYLKDGFDGEIYIPNKNNPSRTQQVEIEDAIVFPLISHTNRMIYDSNSSYTATVGQSNIANVTNGGLEITQLKPAIRVHAIVKAIEAQYKDQDIVFSDDFFNVTNLPYYNLYMWMHTKSGGLFQDQEGGTTTGDFTIANENSSARLRNSVGIIQNGNAFTVPDPNAVDKFPNISEIQRKLSLSVETSVSGKFTVIVYDSEGNEFFSKEGTRDADTNRFVAIKEDEPIDLDNGTYTFAVRSNTPGNFFVYARVERKRESGIGKRFIEFFGESVVGLDTRLTTKLQIPNMTILDFLTGLFKMFNLTAYVNNQNQIVIQTLDEFFNTSENTHNITEFVDKDTVQVDSVVPYAGKSERNGIEISGFFTFNKTILSSSYSQGNYIFKEFNDNGNNYNGNKIPGIPNNVLTISVEHKTKKELSLNLNFKKIGAIYANNSNTTKVDDFSTLNFKIGKEIKLSKSVIYPFLIINNIFEKKYFDNIRINAFGGRHYEPAPERTTFGGLRIIL